MPKTHEWKFNEISEATSNRTAPQAEPQSCAVRHAAVGVRGADVESGDSVTVRGVRLAPHSVGLRRRCSPSDLRCAARASGSIAADGDFEKDPFIAWYQGQSSPYNPSQIVYGDYLYTLYDQGFLTCHDARTGKEVYGKQRFSPAGSFTASPWAYRECLFFLSEDGLTYVVEAGPEFKIRARNPLDELCAASPAIAGDKLLIRTATKLYCLTEGVQRDLGTIQQTRPQVAKPLREKADQDPRP